MNPFGYGNIHGKHERKEQRREAFRDGAAYKNKRWPKGRCKNHIRIKKGRVEGADTNGR